MKNLCLFLSVLCLITFAGLAGADTKTPCPLPDGALVVVSDWSFDGDTPKGFIKEVKEEPAHVESEGGVIKLLSKNSSFGFKKKVKISVKEYPYIHWHWQARILPKDGDVRKKETDDQAGQLYLLFPRFPAKLNTRILGYLWENQTPKGTSGTSTVWSKAKYVVVRDKTDSLGTWFKESRNIYEDYKKLFEEEPPDLETVSVYINSQHTGSEAEMFFGPIYFTREP